MMKEVVSVNLENDMDLILAHKRAMKLCELTGFSLITQTSIATAISEVARCAIDHGKNAELKLGIGMTGKRTLEAAISDTQDFSPRCIEAVQYAKRLVDEIEVVNSPREFTIVLKQQLNFSNTLTESKLKSFIDYFKSEPPTSAYDELRRKNLLLQDMAEKLKESENDFRVLTDSLPLMIFSVTNRGTITYFNKWLQDFFGNIPKDMGPASWQSCLHPEDFSPFSKNLLTAMAKQVPLNGEYRFLEKSTGRYLWHIVSMIPLKNEKNILIRWIGSVVDIHAQKLVEQTLKDNRELKETQAKLYENQAELQKKIIELNRSNYELEQFAHLASHDLQEPLRKLFFYSDVMRQKYRGSIDEYGNNILNNMTAAAGRMKELIHDLLSYSQLQQQTIQFEDVPLDQLIQDIIKDLDIPIKEKSATIEACDLPTVRGNRIRLRQLFANLLSNSLKYSKKELAPHVRISATIENDVASINVKDNGIGFDELYREKIFGLFERLHSRDQVPGTGIGLSICKKIAELHQGTISAFSKPGEYAEFKVTLPLREKIQTAIK